MKSRLKERLFVRFGRHYEIPLLIQSVLMNMAMFALIHLCVQVNAKDRIAGQYKEHVFTGTPIFCTDIRGYVQMLDIKSA